MTSSPTDSTDAQNLLAANLSVSANALALVKTAANAISKGSPILELCHDFVKWLARERLSETEFDYCITLMHGLIVPNENGLEIRRKLSAGSVGTGSRRLCGLPLTFEGSIGRMMAFNPDFVYMVTTVAATMVYHPPEYAVDVLCNMAVDKPKGPEDHVHENGVRQIYTPQKARLRPVLTKIVESIAFTIINLGKDIGNLPDEFKGCCVHVLSASVFAATAIVRIHSINGMMCMKDGELETELAYIHEST